MTSDFSFWGITVHMYGFILGVAVVIWVYFFSQLLQKRAQNVSESKVLWTVVLMLVGAVVGARLWHVATDYWLYRDNLSALFYLWNGGLSIFGALLGGMVGAIVSKKYFLPSVPVPVILDAAVMSLPFVQSIGRWANYVNQEVYGAPTTLPWSITIDQAHRVSGYEHISRYHPLFLYESIAMVLLGVCLWRLKRRHSVGSGVLTAVYAGTYMVWRFVIDFLRIGVPPFLFGLSINQVMMLCGMLGLGLYVYIHNIQTGVVTMKNAQKICAYASRHMQIWMQKKSARIFFFTIILLIFGIGGTHYIVGRTSIVSDTASQNTAQSVQKLLEYVDHEHTTVIIETAEQTTELMVEVVISPESTQQGLSGRSEIGADGMLFVFPQKEIRHFWMPDMKFNIDIVWINDETVVGIRENVLKPMPLQKVLPTYTSNQPVNVVLELPAFRAQELSIQPGSRVMYD